MPKAMGSQFQIKMIKKRVFFGLKRYFYNKHRHKYFTSVSNAVNFEVLLNISEKWNLTLLISNYLVATLTSRFTTLLL